MLRITESAKSLLKTQIIESTIITTNAKISTFIPNHPVVADIIMVAKILSFNNLWLCSIN